MNPIASANEQHHSSQLICAPLVDHNYPTRRTTALVNVKRLNEQSKPNFIIRNVCNCAKKKKPRGFRIKFLYTHLQRSLELAQEKGASVRLTSLRIEKHGFALHKAAFKDALSPIWQRAGQY